MAQFLRPGIDGRFLAFVLLTMLASVIAGGLLAGVFGAIHTGDPAALVFVPMAVMAAAGALVPIAFICWIVPSVVVYSLSFWFCRRYMTAPRVVQVSAVVTTAVASVALGLALSGFGRDIDGPTSFMIFIGPAGVVLAPWLAGRFGLSSWV